VAAKLYTTKGEYAPLLTDSCDQLLTGCGGRHLVLSILPHLVVSAGLALTVDITAYDFICNIHCIKASVDQVL